MRPFILTSLGWFTLAVLLLSAASSVLNIWDASEVPVPATFILMTVVLGGSYWMYLDDTGHKWMGNPALLGGAIHATSIMITVFIRRTLDGTLFPGFSELQLWCLGVSSIVIVYWFSVRRDQNKRRLSYVLLQLVALVAYIPTWIKLADTTEPVTDSYVLWGAILLASLTAVPPAINRMYTKKDWLAPFYVTRSILTTALVVAEIGWRLGDDLVVIGSLTLAIWVIPFASEVVWQWKHSTTDSPGHANA